MEHRVTMEEALSCDPDVSRLWRWDRGYRRMVNWRRGYEQGIMRKQKLWETRE